MKKVEEIIEFLTGNSNDFLMDEVAKKLKITEIDYELSSIYDEVIKVRYNVSFEEIVAQTKNIIVDAIETFNETDKIINT